MRGVVRKWLERQRLDGKSRRTQRRDTECAEMKISVGIGGGTSDQSRPMLALITLFVKYNNSTSIQQVATYVRTTLQTAENKPVELTGCGGNGLQDDLEECPKQFASEIRGSGFCRRLFRLYHLTLDPIAEADRRSTSERKAMNGRQPVSTRGRLALTNAF